MKAKLPGGFLAAWVITAAVVLFCANAALAGGCGKGHGKGHHGRPTFAEVDSNSDGIIVADELYAMQAKRMSARAEAGGKLKHAGNRPTFEDIDTDGNGEVSPEEFARHQAEHCAKRRESGAQVAENTRKET